MTDVTFTPWVAHVTQFKAAQMNAPLTEIADSANTALGEKSDSDHNHDDTYYTETELSTSGGGGQVHWDNVTDKPTIGTGDGDVVGPSSSADNAIVRFDATTGKLVQDSLATIDDNGTVNIPTGQTYNINGTAHRHAAYEVVSIGVSYPSDVKPGDGVTIRLWPPACTIPTDLAGAIYHAAISPAAEVVVSLKKNGGAAFGTLTIAAGSTDVVTLSATETSFNGTTDYLEVVFPQADADWTGVCFKIMGG